MKIDVLKFECGLIGILNIKEGYRITLDVNKWNYQTIRNTYQDILNWFYKKYNEEGNIKQSVSTHHVYSDQWSVFLSEMKYNKKIMIIVTDEDTLKEISKEFDWSYKIDTSQTLYSSLMKILDCYLFSKITDKRLRRIRSEIARLLTNMGQSTQWYDVQVSSDFSNLKFSWNSEQFRLDLNNLELSSTNSR